MLYIRGGFRGPTRPGPPYFFYKNYFESKIYPNDNMYISYIDLKCMLCVYVTVTVQFGNTSSCVLIILTLRSVAMLDCAIVPPFTEILDLPLYMSSLFKFFVNSLKLLRSLYSTKCFEVHCYHVFYIYMYQTSIFGLKTKFGLNSQNPIRKLDTIFFWKDEPLWITKM